MLLVAFDLWNGSGEVLLRDLLAQSPELVTAVAGFMEARARDNPAAMEAWISRWSSAPPS